jgi:hypothetical protein
VIVPIKQAMSLLLRTRHTVGFIEPCLPSPAERPPAGEGWLHEIKHDGFRIMARRDDGGGKPIPESIVALCCTRRGASGAACESKRVAQKRRESPITGLSLILSRALTRHFAS